MFFIDKIAQFERDRQEQQSMIHIQSKTTEHNSEPLINRDQDANVHGNDSTHLKSVYNDLNKKYHQLQIDYESVQTLIEQKNQAYLQCQNELNTYQNLFYHQKKKSDDIDLLRSTLFDRETQLEQLINTEKQFRIKQFDFEEKTRQFQSSISAFEQMQLELKRITHERDLAIVEKKQLENEIESNRQAFLQREELITSQFREDSLKLNKNDQSSLVSINEFETLKDEYRKLEEQMKSSQNFQDTLDQFQQERDKYGDCLQEQISIVARLTNDNNEYQQREKQFLESQETVQMSYGTRVDKQLVKNILLSYFHTPIDKQLEVLPLLGALVDFTQDEYQKAIDAISNHHNQTGTSWFTGWLGANSTKTKISKETSNQSFTELLIQYVDQQSTDSHPFDDLTKLNTDEDSHRNEKNSTQLSNSTSANTMLSSLETAIKIDRFTTI